MLLVAFSLTLLNSCQNRNRASIIEEDARLPHHVAGASDSLILALEKRLRRKHVTVIAMGDNYLISIPSGLIFADQSPRITWEAYNLLNEIACYLRQYRKVAVQVAAYVSPYGSKRREYALSLARSDAVANYLWSQDIESRFVFANSLGSEKPIVMKTSSNDHAANSRIEITFRRVEA